MQNRIYKAITTIVMTAILVLGVLFIFICYELYSREAKDSLISAADTALMSEKEPEKLYDILSQSLQYEVRVTMIAEDGTVLFDSASDSSRAENHLDREEVKEALESGKGTSERFSETLSKRLYYYAVKTDG